MSGSAPDKEQLLKALNDLAKGTRDKVRIFGDIGITIAGVALGAAASGTIAAASGATGIWGLTTAMSWLGISVVAATPAGWIAGTAVAGGAAAYGISRLIHGGGRNEGKLKQIRRHLKDQLRDIERKENASNVSEDDLRKFYSFLKKPLEDDLIEPETIHKLIAGIEEGKIKLSDAYRLVKNILESGKDDKVGNDSIEDKSRSDVSVREATISVHEL